MTKHVHADFWRHIAEGADCGDWEIHLYGKFQNVDNGHLWFIYRFPDECTLRRKPKTSRERFEEWWAVFNNDVQYSYLEHCSSWEAWKEAERQAANTADKHRKGCGEGGEE